MRRKSERNKGKSSPEKKPEKPTRKSTRRRTKKSPSTTPERDNPPDNDNKLVNDTNETTYKIQTRLQNKDTTEQLLIDDPETKVTSTEQLTDEIINDPGSVWKVARADASPGEIQKLKLCRQRNLSETSDISLGKKRLSSKNDGSGSCGGGSSGGNDNFMEEADSADEKPPTTSIDKYNIDNYGLADDTSSTTVGRDSGEEVSDSKEIPPETTTVDMSDVKQNNIDQEEEKPIQPVSTDGIDHKHDDDDHHHHHHADADDAADDGNAEINVKTEMIIGDAVGEKVLDDDGPAFVKELENAGEKENAEKGEEEKENENADDKGEKEEKEKEVEEEKKEVEEEKKEDAGKSVEKSVDLVKSQSSDDEEKPKIECENEETSKNLLRTRSGRRKHRDKYRDSSNSDTGESEDEQERCIDAGDDKKDGESEDVGRVEDEEVKEKDKKEEEKEEVVRVEEGVKEKVEAGESEKDGGSGDAQINVKPAKVNLKRSFTSRISTDESKRDDTESTNDASHDKENHVTEDSKTIPKRRRWGTALSADIAPILSISTDSLKALVPGAKPLSMNEVRLTKDDDDDRERRREKRYTVNECEKGKEEIEAKNDTSKDNHIVARRKISIVKDTPQLISPSPPVAQPTNILLIKNLVRPFTLNQIKELLSRTGTIVENGFWMDRIKSKCFVEYSNEDQAFETRQALHGISWPMSNPKKLLVEYSTREEMDKMKESAKDQPLSRKLEASSGGDPWQQDWGRDDKANATKVTVVREWDLGKEDGQHLLKDKDKEKKDLDKKRRQRSRSPTLEAHLPAPARKFKKKEDEPPPAKLLDDLFRKTKATPSIYWLPLTNEQIVVKEEMRRQHMAEHARRLEEMRRAERSRDNRRRRSPRK